LRKGFTLNKSDTSLEMSGSNLAMAGYGDWMRDLERPKMTANDPFEHEAIKFGWRKAGVV
jgi:hypothetical protein